MSGPGLLGFLALGSLFAWARYEGRKKSEIARARTEEENQRRNTKCKFDDGISEPDFANLALKSAKKIKRIKDISMSGPFIYGKVRSQSGVSTWEFCVDFNDYGHITGKYWVRSENKDSNIPKRLGEIISEQLSLIPPTPSTERAAPNATKTVSIDTNPTKKTRKTKSAKKKKRFFPILFLVIILCVIGIQLFHYWQESKLIPVGVTSTSLHDLNYSDVYETLTATGFTNIRLFEMADLAYDQIESENLVINVSIAGETYFSSCAKFPYDARIIISYHGLKPVFAPLTNKDAKNMDYLDIQTAFVEAGFANIILEPVPDIVLGWFSNVGAVESVSIDGSSKYSVDTELRPDVEVIIKYHSLKNN